MKQKPFTAAQLKALTRNYEQSGGADTDPWPVVKFFCPWGAATWLISEAECMEDGDYMLFGLCDLGHGSPELGHVALSNLQGLRGPWGLTIERDLHFTPNKSLTAYADMSRKEGYISA